MTREGAGNAPTPWAPMLRAAFQRDTDAVTCRLDARGSQCYELCVLPHWNPSAAVIERFEAPEPAVLRHAQIARRLREVGWVVLEQVGVGSQGAA